MPLTMLMPLLLHAVNAPVLGQTTLSLSMS